MTDNLYSQGTITVESIGIFYEQTTTADGELNGELTFGAVDQSKCVVPSVAPVVAAR